MVLVLGAVFEEDSVQLLQMIFGEPQFFPRLKEQAHRFGVASDFLLITRFEGVSPQVGEQRFDLSISELYAFNAGRRSDTFNCRDVPQCSQPFGRKRLQRFPAAFELIYLSYQPQHFVRSPQAERRRFVFRHPRKYTRFYPILLGLIRLWVSVSFRSLGARGCVGRIAVSSR